MAPHHHPKRHRCDPTPTGPTEQDPCPGQAPHRPTPKISTHTGARGDRTSALLHREGATPSSRSPPAANPASRALGTELGTHPKPLLSVLLEGQGAKRPAGRVRGLGRRPGRACSMHTAHSTHTAAGGRVRGRGELMDTVQGPNRAWVLHTQPHHQDSGGHSTSPGAPGSAPRGGRGKRGWRAGRIWPISHRHCWAGWAGASPKSENTVFQGKRK